MIPLVQICRQTTPTHGSLFSPDKIGHFVRPCPKHAPPLSQLQRNPVLHIAGATPPHALLEPLCTDPEYHSYAAKAKRVVYLRRTRGKAIVDERETRLSLISCLALLGLPRRGVLGRRNANTLDIPVDITGSLALQGGGGVSKPPVCDLFCPTRRPSPLKNARSAVKSGREEEQLPILCREGKRRGCPRWGVVLGRVGFKKY